MSSIAGLSSLNFVSACGLPSRGCGLYEVDLDGDSIAWHHRILEKHEGERGERSGT